MKPALGWTLLSRDALRRAEARLNEESQGVRDEIGFLTLHQAYADRFFPGTSVLQTRLRYALFIPWIYERIASHQISKRVETLVQEEEVRLTGRLKNSDETGIIGERTYPRPTMQSPSMIYWTALGVWGILRRLPDTSLPSRSMVNRSLQFGVPGPQLFDDDKQPLHGERTLFVTLPTPPAEWNEVQKPMKFVLSGDEVKFLRKHLIGVTRPETMNTPSLLSRLVEFHVPVSGVQSPWDAPIMKVADSEDKEALIRAKQVAALSAIGRGVYAALVEQICQNEGNPQANNAHQKNLMIVINQHRVEAIKLDVDAVKKDTLSIPDQIQTILKKTQIWLGRRNTSLDELFPLYSQAEINRKGRRARLALTLAGRQRRMEWESAKHPRAEPLHYRWFNVQRLLSDLEGR